MSALKYYCLKCNKINACECGNKDNLFSFSHKLRPPKTLKNKQVWRTFINSCPQFINMIPLRLLPKMQNLLKYIKYPQEQINGRDWKKWDKEIIEKTMQKNSDKILNILQEYGYKLKEPKKLINDVNYNFEHVEHSLIHGEIPYLINTYKYERNFPILKIIEESNKSNIKNEKLLLKLKKSNNEEGEIKTLFQEVKNKKITHKVYKIKNRYYDLNGEHFGIYSVMKQLKNFNEHLEYEIN